MLNCVNHVPTFSNLFSARRDSTLAFFSVFAIYWHHGVLAVTGHRVAFEMCTAGRSERTDSLQTAVRARRETLGHAYNFASGPPLAAYIGCALVGLESRESRSGCTVASFRPCLYSDAWPFESCQGLCTVKHTDHVRGNLEDSQLSHVLITLRS